MWNSWSIFYSIRAISTVVAAAMMPTAVVMVMVTFAVLIQKAATITIFPVVMLAMVATTVIVPWTAVAIAFCKTMSELALFNYDKND
jgi:hypothetical protein